MSHPDNAFYGHDRILARYAGHACPEEIWGHVQHGWSTGTGFSARLRLVSSLPLLGWGERTRSQALAAGLPPVTLIGAPFLYLADPAAGGGPRPRSTIVYPFHGTDRHRLEGSHRRLARAVAEREHGPVTVCLYWADWTPESVAAYEAEGFRVIGHGRRDDPDFLVRQLAELERHDRIVTNRVGTAVWYGAYLGLEAEVYGPRFELQDERDPSHAATFARREWPELHDGRGLRPGLGRELASAELGAVHRRSPAELRSILWPDASTARRRARRARIRMEHRTRWLSVNVVHRLTGDRRLDEPEPPRPCRRGRRPADVYG